MFAAGAPASPARFLCAAPLDERRLRGFRRVPQTPALEPLQAHVRLRPLQLLECGDQRLGLARAKRGWGGAIDDHPAAEELGHGYTRSSRFNFSMSVVRLT